MTLFGVSVFIVHPQLPIKWVGLLGWLLHESRHFSEYQLDKNGGGGGGGFKTLARFNPVFQVGIRRTVSTHSYQL